MCKISDYYYNVLNPSGKYADFSHLFNHYKIHRLKTFSKKAYLSKEIDKRVS